MPSLSRTSVRRHRVAERLLVAVDQIRRGPGDPLEAGQRLGVTRTPCAARDRAQHRRRHDRGRVGAADPAGAAAQSASSTPTSSPRSIRHRRRRTGTRDRAPVGVRVVGDARRSARARAGQREREVHRAGLLRVREARRSGSPGRARPARRPSIGAREAGRGEHRAAAPRRRRRASRCARSAAARGAVRPTQAGDRRRRRRRRSPRRAR